MQYQNGCKGNCFYCGQAREVPGGSECKNLIRVEWPSFPQEVVIERIQQVQDEVERVCVSMITHPRAPKDILTIIRNIRRRVDLPISALITPTLMTKRHIEQIKQAGADRIGIAIDAATPELFYKLRGKAAKGPHTWERYVSGLKEALDVMGEGKVGCHLIVGLGETEKEMISTIQMVHDLGATTHLFSFFPEIGSKLEGRPQPPIGQYRRVQLARYLIDNELSRFESMRFNDLQQVTGFGVDKASLEKIVESGEPFKTSGCPGCNRPYANERPGQPIRNFPFPPNKLDIKQVKRQLWRFETPQKHVRLVTR
jgi:biotin synthase